MATEKQIIDLYNRLDRNTPGSVLGRIDYMNVGLGNTMRFLYRNGGRATAGEISSAIKTSTARTAVLIKSLIQKDFVSKEKSVMDSRVSIVSLTGKGYAEIIKMQTELRKCIALLIDEIGEERINLFMDISNEIRNVFSKLDSICELKEEVNDQNL